MANRKEKGTKKREEEITHQFKRQQQEIKTAHRHTLHLAYSSPIFFSLFQIFRFSAQTSCTMWKYPMELKLILSTHLLALIYLFSSILDQGRNQVRASRTY